MTERDKIIAYLRREADRQGSMRNAEAHNVLLCAAYDIERGEHLIRPEPTIPASEWLPKSNLTY